MSDTESTEYHFAGFIVPVYTQVPDAVFDELLPIITGAELKVLLYVIRRTFGFKKAMDNISIAQIMHGITTRQGQVLDRGTGLSKDAVTRAVKRLVAIDVLLIRRNQSRERGNEATTYALNVRDPLYENRTPPCTKIGQAPVRKSDTQETDQQETDQQEGFEFSNPPLRDKIVDNLGGNFRPTPYLDQVITDFSREFGDKIHAASNRKQARNILAYLDIGEARFVDEYIYPARATTRLATGIDKRMPYFFAVLRDKSDDTPHRRALDDGTAERSG